MKMKSATETVFSMVGGPNGIELVYRSNEQGSIAWTLRSRAMTEYRELHISANMLRRAADQIENYQLQLAQATKEPSNA